MSVYHVLCVLILCLSLVKTQPDTSVCIQTTANKSGPPLPVLPERFSVRVEVNVLNKNSSIDVQEWHDGPGNRGAANMWMTGLPLAFIYSYSTDELFCIEHLAGGDHRCTVQELTSTDQPYLHGNDNSPDGHNHIYSAEKALSFGGSQQEQYIGQTTARGITTDVWRACVYWPEMKATMVVDWHFTVKEGWDSAVGYSQIPVRCHVTGTTGFHGKELQAFQHLYEVTDFRPYLDSGTTVFETPPGTVCAGRKNTKPLPVLADFFAYSAEVLNIEQQYTQNFKKAYDRNLKLAMMEFVSAAPPQSTLRLIDDFNTGASYTVDLIRGNCSVATINPAGFDTIRSDAAMLRMRTPREFFFNLDTDYSYEGVRNMRMLNTDVWVGIRQGWPPNDPTNSTWEYYFLTSEWEENSGTTNNGSIPVSIHVSLGRQNAHQVYNIYSYHEGDPYIWTYDITSCFSNSRQTRLLQLAFPVTAAQQQIVVDNQNAFRSALLRSITALVPISPVRLNNIQLDYRDGSLIVSLVLVEAVTPASPVVSSPLQEADLTTAVGYLQAAMANNTFTLTFRTRAGTVILIAQPYNGMSTPAAHTGGVSTPAPNPALSIQPGSLPQSTQTRSLPETTQTGNTGRSSGQAGRRALVCSANQAGYTSGDVAGVTMGAAFSSYLLVLGGLLVWTRHREGTRLGYHRDRMELS